MSVSVIDELGEFDGLQKAWQALLPQCATDSLFLTWEWQRAWWETFGQGKELRIVTVRDVQGKLTGIAPLFLWQAEIDPRAAVPNISVENPLVVSGSVGKRVAHLIGGTEVSDYLDVLSSGQDNQMVWRQVLDALGGAEWEILDLNCIPAASPTLVSVPAIAQENGWKVHLSKEDVCPQIELPSTWDEYLAVRLDKKQRHELRRKVRRAEEEVKVAWQWVDAAGFAAGLETFFRLHKASHPEKEAFMDKRMQGFFRSAAAAALERDWLRLALLEYNGEPVASYLCFDYGGDRLVYNSGFDLHRYGSLTPGIVLLGYLVRDAIEVGRKKIDFLQGNERYKYDMGARDTDVMRLIVQR